MQPAVNLNRYAPSAAALLLAGLCAGAALPAYAQFPTVTTRTETWTGSGPRQEQEAFERAQWEPWQLQREQQRRQFELTRQQDAQLRESQESPGQRALREQAQNRREQGRMSSGDKR